MKINSNSILDVFSLESWTSRDSHLPDATLFFHAVSSQKSYQLTILKGRKSRRKRKLGNVQSQTADLTTTSTSTPCTHSHAIASTLWISLHHTTAEWQAYCSEVEIRKRSKENLVTSHSSQCWFLWLRHVMADSVFIILTLSSFFVLRTLITVPFHENPLTCCRRRKTLLEIIFQLKLEIPGLCICSVPHYLFRMSRRKSHQLVVLKEKNVPQAKSQKCTKSSCRDQSISITLPYKRWTNFPSARVSTRRKFKFDPWDISQMSRGTDMPTKCRLNFHQVARTFLICQKYTLKGIVTTSKRSGSGLRGTHCKNLDIRACSVEQSNRRWHDGDAQQGIHYNSYSHKLHHLQSTVGNV